MIGFSNIEEFIAYAKEHPGEVKVGNAGTGSIWHLGAIGMEKAADITFTMFLLTVQAKRLQR